MVDTNTKFMSLFLSTKSSDSCLCSNYQPVELLREHISKRIRESKKIKKNLALISKYNVGHELYQCNFCQQYWQHSIAWNWNGKSYFFKVPEIAILEWKAEAYVSPADLLIHSAMMSDYFKDNMFVESSKNCRKESCNQNALSNDVLCRSHFIESLQNFGMLPPEPKGRIFKPYS